jgi:3,4-dihydroxy 2-butanone 4-phosphate synthase/GTP cyclohydrolase II
VHEPITVLDLLETHSSTHSWPLSKAIEMIANAPSGVVVLLNAAGIASPNDSKWLSQFDKLCQKELGTSKSNLGNPGPSALERKTDFRSYGVGAQILKDLGVKKMRLLANSSRVPSLSGYKLEITDHIPFSASK